MREGYGEKGWALKAEGVGQQRACPSPLNWGPPGGHCFSFLVQSVPSNFTFLLPLFARVAIGFAEGNQ